MFLDTRYSGVNTILQTKQQTLDDESNFKRQIQSSERRVYTGWVNTCPKLQKSPGTGETDTGKQRWYQGSYSFQSLWISAVVPKVQLTPFSATWQSGGGQSIAGLPLPPLSQRGETQSEPGDGPALAVSCAQPFGSGSRDQSLLCCRILNSFRCVSVGHS